MKHVCPRPGCGGLMKVYKAKRPFPAKPEIMHRYRVCELCGKRTKSREKTITVSLGKPEEL